MIHSRHTINYNKKDNSELVHDSLLLQIKNATFIIVTIYKYKEIKKVESIEYPKSKNQLIITYQNKKINSGFWAFVLSSVAIFNKKNKSTNFFFNFF